jgi:hypothetical protein
MENDITLDEPLMKVVQNDEYPLLRFQSVIMGLDGAVRRGYMEKDRLMAIEKLLRPYANVSGLKAALHRRRSDIPQHLKTKFDIMLGKSQVNDPDITKLMYEMYFKIIYSVHYGETAPDFTDTIEKVTIIGVATKWMRKDMKNLIRMERKQKEQCGTAPLPEPGSD